MADDYLSTIATTGALPNDGFVRGSLEAPGDQDWFKIDVQAGTDYRFWVSGTGPNADLNVSFHVYDANGNDTGQSFNTDGAFADFWYDWTLDTGGTYYVGITSNDGSTGDYTVALNKISNSPLDAIDWGTRVSTSAIQVYFAHAGQTYDDYFQGSMPAVDLTPYEKQQALAAYAEFAKFANVSFSETTDEGSANLKFVLTDTGLANTDLFGFYDPPGTVNEGLGVIAGASNTYWDPTPGGSIEKGGRDWTKLLHEIGHALGMAHPHDTGGASEVMHGVTEGVATGDFGDFDLNQGINTVMSYNNGWETAPQGVPMNGADFNRLYGWMGTPMALDIAVIQAKYGANMSYHTGNDTYTMPDHNASGTYYSCIWDAGGTDTIQAGNTTAACTIDLRAATLLYEAGGGGWVSYEKDIFGGFTIAHNVVIENATGGGGADTLTGNTVANRLDGGKGGDTMTGGAGDDTYVVDNAADVADETGGAGKDTVESSVAFSLADTLRAKGALENLTLTGGLSVIATGNGAANALKGNAGNNVLDGMGNADTMKGGAGNDTYVVDNSGDVADETGGSGKDTVKSGVNFSLSDAHAKGAIETLVLTGSALKGTGAGGDETLLGNASGNTLSGLGGDDTLKGGDGGDTLVGGGGTDDLYASADAHKDIFSFDKGDSGDRPKGADHVFDFDAHKKHAKVWDRIDLSAIDADKHAKHDQDLRFVDHFAKAHGNHPDGEVMVQGHGKNVDVLVDFDGDKQTDMLIQVMHIGDLHKADFIL